MQDKRQDIEGGGEMKEKATIFDYARMCKKHKDCRGCPLSIALNGMKVVCLDLIKKYTDKANEIILNWRKEHPVETRQGRFLKMFPNAEKLSLGGLDICPKSTDKTYDCETFLRMCRNCKRDYLLAEVEVEENE